MNRLSQEEFEGVNRIEMAMSALRGVQDLLIDASSASNSLIHTDPDNLAALLGILIDELQIGWELKNGIATAANHEEPVQ